MDGCTHRDLALACRRAHQEQRGRVRARDQQHQRDGAEEDPERVTNASRVDIAMREEPKRLAVRCERRVGSAKRVAQRFQIGRARGLRCAMAQATNDIGIVPLIGRIRLHGVRHEIAGVARRRRKPELRRQHSHDRSRLAVEADLPPEDAGIGTEARAPHVVAQNHDRRSTRLELARIELAAETWTEADRAEEAAAHAQAAQRLRRGLLAEM
jgi:hypothetical protein